MLLEFKKYIFNNEQKVSDLPINNRRLISFEEWYLEMADSNAPSCPECGSPMILRTARNTGNKFWGCSKFPNCRGTKGYSANYPSQTGNIAQKQTPPKNVPISNRNQPNRWVYAKIIDPNNSDFNQKVAARPIEGGNYYYVLLNKPFSNRVDQFDDSKVIPNYKLKQTIQSYQVNGKPVFTTQPSLMDFEDKIKADELPERKKEETFTPTEEQASIEKRFEKMIESPEQSHMMINALAGTGKTTTLKYLAQKFGSPGQSWLYLVFNTKNKVEATEKFPKFVKVRTTNGFLGEVLKEKKNFSKIPQTERIAMLNSLKKDEEGSSSGKLEKARIIVDSSEFAAVMEKLGIPNRNADSYAIGSIAKTINSLLKSIRYQFKEQVLTLVGLSKSFSLDPRKDLNQGLDKILNSYDFDTDISDVKERISKYSGNFKQMVIAELHDFLNYDFMDRDYKKEMKEAAKWLLEKSMPNATQQKYKYGNKDYNLGEFRDFSDDLWYAAVHADEIHWPHYDIVMADEVQDFNEAQKIMLKKLHDAGAKIVAVGDPGQSIYRFRGADSEAFKNISDTLKLLSGNKDVEHKLSKNFRSRPEIIDFSNQETHIKNLMAGKNNEDGKNGIATKYEKSYSGVFYTLKREKQNNDLKQTAFISRTNEPLVHAALKLLTDNVPFIILGKDISNDLKKHIKKISLKFGISDNDPVYDLEEKINEFIEQEKEHHEGKAVKKAYLQELEETTNALISSLQQFESGSNSNATVGQFNRWISQKLGGLDVEENEKDLKQYKEKMKENPVVLTTAHKSKGLEFSRVYLLRYDQFPHKKAQREEDLKQEENARYVAITRAKDELHIVDLKGQPGVKEK